MIIATSAAPILASADPNLPELELTDPIAIALGYQEDANLVDTNKFPKRAGAEGAKQFCDNCTLYKEVRPGFGTCTAIRGKLVAGKGWCNAWVLAN